MLGGAGAVGLTAAKSDRIRQSAVSSEQLGCSRRASKTALDSAGARQQDIPIFAGPSGVRAQGWNGAVSLVSLHEWVSLELQATP